MKKILLLVAVIIIGVAIWMFAGDKSPAASTVAKLDASDTVSTFYGQWLKSAQDPKATPNMATLAKSPLLSPELSTRLENAQKNQIATVDPVLCQTKVPTNITVRSVYEKSDKAEGLVTSTDKKVTEEAVVDLTKSNGGWLINSIECSAGEFAPAKEFTFEAEGFLLKNSIPKPYNSKNWHIVFTDEKGVAGNVVPLIFNSKSECIDTDGKKSVCNTATLQEVTKVSIKGQMTELGASVTMMEFLK